MNIAILSDTHGLLRPEVVEHLKTADTILYAGDINRQEIVDQLSRRLCTSAGPTTTKSGRRISLTTSLSP